MIMQHVDGQRHQSPQSPPIPTTTSITTTSSRSRYTQVAIAGEHVHVSSPAGHSMPGLKNLIWYGSLSTHMGNQRYVAATNVMPHPFQCTIGKIAISHYTGVES
jgi:hypothetical protein